MKAATAALARMAAVSPPGWHAPPDLAAGPTPPCDPEQPRPMCETPRGRQTRFALAKSGRADGTAVAFGVSMMDALRQDLRYALRGLVRTPTFTTIAVLTVAIGTGANITVFSFVSALLFRPAPGVADPRSLIAIYTSDFSSGPYGDTSYPDFLSLQRDAIAFRTIAAEQDDAIESCEPSSQWSGCACRR